MARRIVIAANPVEPITVELIGKEYIVEPPKAVLGVLMAQRLEQAGDDVDKVFEELGGWLTAAMGEKQSKKVMERLRDPDDKLDIPHISSLMRQLTEEVAGNPTT